MMSDCVYLDWASSAPIKYFAKDYYVPGNPNSQHNAGIKANQALNEARQRIMDCLGVRSGKVLFCRCATDAVEWLCRQFKEQHYAFITMCSKYEHDSCCDIIDCGWNDKSSNEFAEWIESDKELKPTRGLYLHQYVNQLTGIVFPIESIGKQVQSTGAFFGSDFTAAIGHYPLPDNLESFCDTVWFSGHKFGAEPGTGAIWLSDRLFKYLGGSEDSRNEHGLIHGTPNVSAAVAMSYAMKHAVREAKTNNIVWGQLVNYMCTKLLENGILHHIQDIENTNKTYAINALYLPKFNADSLTQHLSSKSIYISPGHSACSNDAADATRVLEAFGLTKQEASQTVRISFGESTTREDIDALVKGIVEFKEMFV